MFFFFKQKTAYEMRISDWSSDVCSSDLSVLPRARGTRCSSVRRSSAPAPIFAYVSGSRMPLTSWRCRLRSRTSSTRLLRRGKSPPGMSGDATEKPRTVDSLLLRITSGLGFLEYRFLGCRGSWEYRSRLLVGKV